MEEAAIIATIQHSVATEWTKNSLGLPEAIVLSDGCYAEYITQEMIAQKQYPCRTGASPMSLAKAILQMKYPERPIQWLDLFDFWILLKKQGIECEHSWIREEVQRIIEVAM